MAIHPVKDGYAQPVSFRIVVLVSGSGTLMQALLEAIDRGECLAQVVAVGSDRSDAPALLKALEAGIPIFTVPMLAERAEWDAKLADTVESYRPDLVVSAGFMKLVGAGFLAKFGGRFINTHPALLPSFPGMHAVRDALAHGVKVSGCTVFMVDEGIDTGRILDQRAVRVKDGDTEESLHERIKVAERAMLIETVNELNAQMEGSHA